jgi:hypothetical protein
MDIFNAYRDYIKAKPNISHPKEIEILKDVTKFKNFANALLEDVESKKTRDDIYKLLERQRNVLLTENIGGHAPIITNFPLLVDTFANLSAIRAAVWYPTDAPVVTVPRLELHGEVLTQNDEVKTFVLNNAKQKVRGEGTNLELTPDATPKVYENLLSIHTGGGGVGDLDTLFINRQFSGINKIILNDDGVAPYGTFTDTTTDIIITSSTIGTTRNGDTIQIVINAPAANPTNTVLLDITGDIDAVVMTITPNDGTNNGATPVEITSLALVGAITAGVTGTYASINVTVTDTSSLLTDLTATGGDSEQLTNGHAIDGDTITLAGGIDDDDIIIDVNILPDARGHWSLTIPFIDNDDVEQTFDMYGNINWDTSIFTCYFNDIPSRNSIDTLQFHFYLSPKTSDINRVKFDLYLESKDCIIDPDDNFELKLPLNVMQDYTVFDVDILEIISDILKQQLSINDSHDVGETLISMDHEIEKHGGSFVFDYSNYTGYDPHSLLEDYSSIVPTLLYAREYVYIDQFGIKPQYIVTNHKMSYVLRSISSHFEHYFNHENILTSSAITNDIVYLVYKPSTDNLMKSGLIALIHNPFYLIREVTDSVQKIFVKSRTMITYGTALACAKIEVLNVPKGLYP